MAGRRGIWIPLAGCAGMMCLVCGLVLVLPRFVLQTVEVEGTGMEPALRARELLFVNPRAYKRDDPARGDIVVFLHARGGHMLKRVIGLPGELVYIRDGRVRIDGELLEEPYIDRATRPGRGGPWELSDNEVFVLGDNRNHSNDSRSFGAVPLDSISRKVVFVLAPDRMEVVPGVSYPGLEPGP